MKSDLDQVLEAGTLLIIETGEYSDQSWSGPVKVLKTVTKRELVDAFKAQWKPGEHSWRDAEDGPGENDFLPWLVSSGHVEDVQNVHSWHVGNYGSFEP
jgi:hypothetical protein